MFKERQSLNIVAAAGSQYNQVYPQQDAGTMWILIFIFGLISLLLAWVLFGYFLFLWLVGLLRGERKPTFPSEWPRLSLIIPCYNEERIILDKLKNTRTLDYPSDRLEVLFVDGGSTDRTAALLEEALQNDGRCQVLRSPFPGKIAQMNAALPLVKGEIVVNTDADAMLDPNALRWLAAEFASAPDVGVVGAYCAPDAQASLVDRYYWDAQNKGRFIESRAGTSSIVVAPCYAFRRDLLARFPDDVVADDVYVAFLAGCQGWKTVYSKWACAVETRNPKTLVEFLPHKFRKSNAFLRESLRFMYRLPEMKGLFKTIFLTRIAQQLLLPWLGIGWCLTAGALMTSWPEPRFDVVGLCAAILFFLFACTSRVFYSVKLPGEDRLYGFTTMVEGYILTNLILLGTGLSYPFYSQRSTYARLGSAAASPSAQGPLRQDNGNPHT